MDFSQHFQGGGGATDCWWWERLCFLFWNVMDNIKCTIQSLHICTAYWISLSMIIVISFQVNLLEAIHTLQIFWSACYLSMIYTIKVKPTILELILYSIVYSIKHKISDPKSMQFRKILKNRFLFHSNWREKIPLHRSKLNKSLWVNHNTSFKWYYFTQDNGKSTPVRLILHRISRAAQYFHFSFRFLVL